MRDRRSQIPLNHADFGRESGGGEIRTHERAFTRCRFSKSGAGHPYQLVRWREAGLLVDLAERRHRGCYLPPDWGVFLDNEEACVVSNTVERC